MTDERAACLTEDERRRLTGIVRVVAELDAKPPRQMDTLFYACGYNEPRLAVEALLTILGMQPPSTSPAT